ncbi:hypothetical protein JZ751_026669, partial [Albula glossodonta]
MLVSVELLDFSEELFLVSASADRTARLWTCDGRYVGWFGQKQKWNLSDPVTYQHPRDPWGQQKEATENKVEEREEQEWGPGKKSQSKAATSDHSSAGTAQPSPAPPVPSEKQMTVLSPTCSPSHAEHN